MAIFPLLTVQDLSFSFPGRTLWNDLSFTARSQEYVVITGESGSGKTTLLQCLGSLEKPTSGRIFYNDVEVSALKGKEQRSFLRNHVSFVFQNSGLVPSWNVRKNLEFGGFKVEEHQEQVYRACERFGLNTQLLDTPAYQLSGGEQQRIGIIRAAVRETPLILLDEPTAALDDYHAQCVLDFLQEHCRNGGIAIVVTHDYRVIEQTNSRVHLTAS
ncbi:ABC transporter ATP-binding protein [Rothia sp. P7181]|uniref:ABC transporter ATP-binding protein n=1 Tax=unclassified Rothia (in: high G+C Gram-positive bacteria) TaxID=2689056 RepID=UPI003AC29739